GGIVDFMTVLVVADPAQGPKAGTSRLFVERAVSPWQHREIPCVAMRNLSFAEITFGNVRVPRENLLGEKGAGTDAFLRAIEASRALVAMQAAGIGRVALDLAVAYARE